jgi:glutamate-1-semialdehyde aminotransferase
LDALDRTAIARINGLAARLAEGITQAADAHALPITLTGCGSLMNMHSLPDVVTPDDAHRAANEPLCRLLHLTLLEHGIFMAARGELCTSTAMDDATIDDALARIGSAFEAVQAAVTPAVSGVPVPAG